MIGSRHSQGFTLIELMLSMAFISVLLVSIAMLTISISQLYNRGMTLREVNQSGSAISTDIQRTIMSSSTRAINKDKNLVIAPGGGRVCFGNYSYAWNNASTIYGESGDGSVKEAYSMFNHYDTTSSRSGEVIKLVKVQGDSICQYGPSGEPEDSPIPVGAVELLGDSKSTLAIHEMGFSGIDEETTAGLFTVYFKLGTDSSAIDSAGCKLPGDSGANADFCAINEFKFTVQSRLR